MKNHFLKTLLVIMVTLHFGMAVSGQRGKYAGTKKDILGISFTDSKKITALKGWSFVEASVLTPVNDAEVITVNVFKKDTMFVVFFSVKEDTSEKKFIVADVLQIRSPAKGYLVKTSFCRNYKTDDAYVIAIAKQTKTAYLISIKKAWRFNRDKKELEIAEAKNVDCLNEGFDND